MLFEEHQNNRGLFSGQFSAKDKAGISEELSILFKISFQK